MAADGDMPWGWLVAGATAVAGLIGGAIKWRRSGGAERRKDDVERRKEERTTLKQVWEIVDRQDRQIKEQQRDIGHLYDMHSRCLVRGERMYGLVTSQHEMLARWAVLLRARGIDMPDPPPLPPREGDAESEQAHAAFLARTEQTNATLSHDVKERLRGDQP